MSGEQKRQDGPKPGRRKPGAGERKRRYGKPPLPKAAPSREVGINQHEERPEPVKEQEEELEGA